MEDNSHKKKRGQKWVLVLIGIICIVVAFVLLILFLLQGNTKTISEGGNVETAESITCSSEDFSYPFFKYDASKSKSIKINALFNDGKLETITLTYRLNYDSVNQAERSSDENHISMNDYFAEDSLGPDSFNANFSVLKNTLQLSLYANAKDVTGITSKYFLIDNTSNNHQKDSLTKMYNAKGLDCIISQ